MNHPQPVPRRRVQFGLLIAVTLVTWLATSLLAAAEQPVDLVDPLIDTHNSRWFYFNSACRPFGLVNLSPDTRTGGDWQAGYLYGDQTIRCFSHVHAWQLWGIAVMPTTGELTGPPVMDAYQSPFSHANETVEPGYHKVVLERYGVTAELTSTCRVGWHRYTFPAGAVGRVLFDVGATLGDGPMLRGHVTRVNDRELVGWSLLAPTMRRPKATAVYFVARFERPFARFGGWRDGQLLADDATQVEGPQAGAFVEYPDAGAQPVVLRVALSYTGIDGARRNLDAEAAEGSFEQVRRDARAEWNQWLSRFEIRGGERPHRVKFYTDLWHALLGRRIISDVDGRYCDMTGPSPVVRRMPTDAHGAPWPHYNFDALWGSHWSLNILWPLAYPRVVDGFCNTMVAMYQNGGLIPRGPAGGNYTYVMMGDPAAPFVAAAYHRGIRNYDVDVAYEGLRKNAFVGGIRDHAGYEHAADARGGGMQYYLDLGYVPEDMGGAGLHRDGAAMTLEYAYQDWCLAQLARSLGRADDAAEFARRALNYRRLWDPALQVMRPRMKDGSWMPDFQPLGTGVDTPGFTESNARIYTHFVPHDVAGLASLFGGEDAYAATLNDAFEKSRALNFLAAGEAHGAALVAYDNQPGTGMAHLFNRCGRPWLAQKWVRAVKLQAYGETTPYGGYHGDEDEGQMGALGVLMAVGLFQIDGGAAADSRYELTAPLFDEVTLHLDPAYAPGRTFRLLTRQQAPENCFIQAAVLNGVPLDRCWLAHDEIVAGGTLELTLGPEPNPRWGLAD